MENETDLHAVNMQGDTLLHLALHNPNERASIEKIRLLVEKGLNVNQPNKNNATALHAAIQGRQDIAIIAYLIEQGADVNAMDAFGNNPACLALIRSAYDHLELLLKSGTDVNERVREGTTLLIEAAEYTNKETVALLIEYGADPNLTDRDGQMAIDVTGQKHDIRDFLAPLTQLSPVAMIKDMVCRGDLPALIDALAEGASLDVEDYLTRKNPLHWAVNCRQRDMLVYLLTTGIDVNRKDSRHQSPLHDAALVVQDAQLAGLLIEKGANVNAHKQSERFENYSDTNFDTKHDTAAGEYLLHAAISKEVPIDVVELLLKSGAVVDVKDNWFYTPLALAVLRNRSDYVRLLLQHGADKRIADRDGRKPYDHAKKRKLREIKKLLR